MTDMDDGDQDLPEDEAGSEQPDDEAANDATPPSSGYFENVGKQLYSSIFKNLTAGLSFPSITDWLPPIKPVDLFPHLKMTTLGIEPGALGLGKSLADIVQMQRTAIVAPFAQIFEQQREQWDSLFESMRRLAESLFPPNWKGVKHPDIKTIEAILLDEGIPLAWIPSREIVQALFDASSAVERRRIIGKRWKRVVSDCEIVLSEISHPSLECHQPFVLEIVQTLRAGHVSAAQALATNLLDSMLRRNFEKQEFKEVTTNKKGGNRFDLDAYQIRAAFTLAPVWRAYAQYWENQGDPIPRTFGRHPSAHAVSRTQYSRINTVIALMLVTSLLKLLDEELSR